MLIIIGQIFGLLNAVFTIICYQVREKSTMLMWSFAANLAAGLNMIFIGQYVAGCLGVINLVQIVINIIYCRKNKDAGMPLRIVFGTLTAGAGLLSYQNPVDCLRIASNLANVAAVFQQNAQRARYWYLVNGVLYLMFAAAVGSSLVLSMIINNIILLVGIYRFRNKKTEN